MNYKVAGITSIGLYIASFIVGMLISSFLNINIVPGTPLPTTFLLVQVALAMLMGAAGTTVYFMKSGVPASAKSGLFFGAISVVVGFVLDFILFIPGMMYGYSLQQLASFYAEPWFWITLISMLMASSLTGFVFLRWEQ